MLTHYTKQISVVASILTNGFGWRANPRRLADLLLPSHDYSVREPQQFGMISFTELSASEAAIHREAFGQFGISVTNDWSSRHGAQRVIYVHERGPLTDALRALYAMGYRDISRKIRYPEDKLWQMAFENKAVASSIAGSSLWAHLLSIWEYLEPNDCSPQREWRIVNSLPDYSAPVGLDDFVRGVSPPVGWGHVLRVLPIAPMDVHSLICPSMNVDELRQALPPTFRGVTINTYDSH